MEKRSPRQKRAIEKKEKIIEKGFELICKNGYYNTNTAEIAKEAGVSTGIVYQYFEDKHSIFIEALNKYGDNIFFPTLDFESKDINIKNFKTLIRNVIKTYISDHKASKIAHEEIMSMVHSDKDVAKYYYEKEVYLTQTIKEFLLKNNVKDDNLSEKVHIMVGLVENLCHEVVYHKHNGMNYDVMTEIVILEIQNLFKNDL